MVNHKKKPKKAKKHHIGSSPDAAIVLRPPSPTPPPTPSSPSTIPLEATVNDHTHIKNHKSRVIVMIWSRRSTACYETEFCPQCPANRVQNALLNFCKADTSYFSRVNWLTFKGMNDDTVHKTFSPHSPYQMAEFMTLIETRDLHGGKITLKIVRKGQAMSFWVVFVPSVIIILSLVMITLKDSHAEINNTLLSFLSVPDRLHSGLS